MGLEKLSSIVRTMEDSSSRRIMRLVAAFILETHNQTNNKCLPKFVQTDNASSCVKRPMSLSVIFVSIFAGVSGCERV